MLPAFFSLLVLAFSSHLHSQCIAEAGEPVDVCSFWALDTAYLGGSPTAMAGTPPYTCVWTAYYTDEFGEFTAGNFLDDVTNANPGINDWLSWIDSLMFYLKVTDNNGLTCTDSVLVRFSTFTITLDVKHAHIHQGDSTQLHTSVSGGIQPLTYQWSPTNGLTDPTDVFTYAKPLSTTTYNLTITDDGGCEVYDDFYVFVVPTSTNPVSLDLVTVNLAPNPVTDVSTFIMDDKAHLLPLQIKIFDAFGRPLKTVFVDEEKSDINTNDFAPGLYFYHVIDTNKILAKGKFVVQ